MKPGTKSAMMWLSLTVLACVAALTANAAQAVMPPYVYEKQARESKVKAIAVLEDVVAVGENDHSVTQKLRFKVEKSLVKDPTPDTVFGTCHSIKPGEHPPPGGTIYYRPEAGKRYFVTISSAGGEITSLTLLTPDLEKALLEQPDKVKFSFGSAKVKE